MIDIYNSTRSNTLKVINRLLWEKISSNLEVLPKDTLDLLAEGKIIVPKEEDERKTILNENLQHIANTDNLYISVQPTAACPLGCGYCGQRHEDKNMKQEVRIAIIDRITKKLAAKKYNSLSITWFGAEPLSGYSAIKDLSTNIFKLTDRYNLKYNAKIITNGYLLNPDIIYDLINVYKIKEFEITLDGTAEFHDARRHTKAGGITFDKIYDNILLLSKYAEAQIVIRCNVDDRNKDGVVPLLNKLKQDNLHKKIKFYVAPIHSWGNDAHMLAAEKTNFADWELEWLIDMSQMGFHVNYLPMRNKSVCFTVNPNNELIDPFGEVFSCSEVSLVPFYNDKKGKNIHALGNTETAPLNHPNSPWGNFYSEDVISRYDCGTCVMLPTCGGGCPKEWSEGRIPCPPTKFNIKQRMLLEYIRSQAS